LSFRNCILIFVTLFGTRFAQTGDPVTLELVGRIEAESLAGSALNAAKSVLPAGVMALETLLATCGISFSILNFTQCF